MPGVSLRKDRCRVCPRGGLYRLLLCLLLVVLCMSLRLVIEFFRDAELQEFGNFSLGNHSRWSTLGSSSRFSRKFFASTRFKRFRYSMGLLENTTADQSDPALQPAPVNFSVFRVLIFTMDSLPDYIESAKTGGASGELKIRNSLQDGLQILGVPHVVAGSDEEFETLFRTQNFSHVMMDQWTVVDRDHNVKINHSRIFAFAFFGTENHKSGLPPERFLTAYPYSFNNTFLGFMMPDPPAASINASDRKYGLVWGKRRSYFEGQEGLLLAIKAAFPSMELVTGIGDEGGIDGLRNMGHLTPDEWQATLRQSYFIMGLGHPLGGPSPLEALAAGAVYINPTFGGPDENHPFYTSQHPFLQRVVGMPRVCDADLRNSTTVFACVRHALDVSLAPYVPPDLQQPAYLARLRSVLLM